MFPISSEIPMWATAPIIEVRTVSRAQVKVRADGILGERQDFYFSGSNLWEHEGRQVRVAFDPLCPDDGATILEAKVPKVIGRATCTSAVGGGTLGESISATQRARSMVRLEYRSLGVDHSSRKAVAKNSETRISLTMPAAAAEPTCQPASREPMPVAATPRREAGTPVADISQSLRRHASRIQTAEVHW